MSVPRAGDGMRRSSRFATAAPGFAGPAAAGVSADGVKPPVTQPPGASAASPAKRIANRRAPIPLLPAVPSEPSESFKPFRRLQFGSARFAAWMLLQKHTTADSAAGPDDSR